MKICISGAVGFIGSHLAEYYAIHGHEVIGIDNFSRSRLLNQEKKEVNYNYEYLKRYENIKIYNINICNFSQLLSFFNLHKFDLVIHCAAQTAVTTSIKRPMIDFNNNCKGSFLLLETIRITDQDPILLYCSTNKVFGDNINLSQIVEKGNRYDFKKIEGISEYFNIDLCEHTPYGVSKLCGDLYFQEYGKIYGFKTAIFRMSCIYGPRQAGIEDQGWVIHFILSALKDKLINIYGDGKQVRDILYISDLVEVFNSFVKYHDIIDSNVFNIGGGPTFSISLLELIEMLGQILDKEIYVKFHPWRPSDQKVYISNTTKAKEMLNWEPLISPLEGVKKTIKWAKRFLKLYPSLIK